GLSKRRIKLKRELADLERVAILQNRFAHLLFIDDYAGPAGDVPDVSPARAVDEQRMRFAHGAGDELKARAGARADERDRAAARDLGLARELAGRGQRRGGLALHHALMRRRG